MIRHIPELGSEGEMLVAWFSSPVDEGEMESTEKVKDLYRRCITTISRMTPTSET